MVTRKMFTFLTLLRTIKLNFSERLTLIGSRKETIEVNAMFTK
jgi:hypothetical protein